jgi:hypothetical protein
MNTDSESVRKEAARISRRSMLGKSAKYAALIPVSTLIATKASAHAFSGTNAECEQQGGVSTNHCDIQHPDPV